MSVPVSNWEPSLFDDMMMTGLTFGTNYGDLASQTQIVIANSAHPMAAGLSGTVTTTNTGQIYFWAVPRQTPTSWRTLVGYSGRAAIFAYEAGDTMVGMNAPARRAGFFNGYGTTSRPTAGRCSTRRSSGRWLASRYPPTATPTNTVHPDTADRDADAHLHAGAADRDADEHHTPDTADRDADEHTGTADRTPTNTPVPPTATPTNTLHPGTANRNADEHLHPGTADRDADEHLHPGTADRDADEHLHPGTADRNAGTRRSRHPSDQHSAGTGRPGRRYLGQRRRPTRSARSPWHRPCRPLTCRPAYRALHDGTNLYLLVQVTDQTLRQRQRHKLVRRRHRRDLHRRRLQPQRDRYDGVNDFQFGVRYNDGNTVIAGTNSAPVPAGAQARIGGGQQPAT